MAGGHSLISFYLKTTTLPKHAFRKWIYWPVTHSRVLERLLLSSWTPSIWSYLKGDMHWHGPVKRSSLINWTFLHILQLTLIGEPLHHKVGGQKRKGSAKFVLVLLQASWMKDPHDANLTFNIAVSIKQIMLFAFQFELFISNYMSRLYNGWPF